MASDPERGPVDDDTVVVDANGAGPEEITQTGDHWPVSDLYYVDSDEEAAPALADETLGAEVTPGPASKRRFPPPVGVGVLFAVLGVVAALVLGAILLGLDDDPAATARTPAPPATTAPPTETTTAPVPDEVEVANVEGMSLAKARGALEEQGFDVRVTRSASERPVGEVLGQQPPAGSEIAAGTVVALVVARGTGSGEPARNDVTVPGVVGLLRSAAVSTVRDAGLDARVRLVTSPERRGTVLDQSPAEGTDVEEGSTVRLEVAKPAAVVRVDVPDVVGSTASAARSSLRAVGLTVATTAAVSAEAAGTVISQSPRAGAKVRRGTQVKLTVSSGPADVAVPDVTGLDEASARRELEGSGFQIQLTDESITDPAQDGVVLRQTPPGGSTAEDGAVVTLVVGRLG